MDEQKDCCGTCKEVEEPVEIPPQGIDLQEEPVETPPQKEPVDPGKKMMKDIEDLHNQRSSFLEDTKQRLEKMSKDLPSRKALVEVCKMLYNFCVSINFPISGILRQLFIVSNSVSSLDAGIVTLSTRLQAIIDVLAQKGVVSVEEVKTYHDEVLVPQTIQRMQEAIKEELATQMTKEKVD